MASLGLNELKLIQYNKGNQWSYGDVEELTLVTRNYPLSMQITHFSFNALGRWDHVLCWKSHNASFNTLRTRQNVRQFADDTLKYIFLNENVRIAIEISLKFVSKCPINNIPALVQKMAWRQPGDKPLSEPMTVRLLSHICVTRSQWVAHISVKKWCTVVMVATMAERLITLSNTCICFW